MLEAAERIQNYIEGYSRAEFEGDQRTVDAVVRNLEILAEAANALPASIQELAAEIDWRGVIGLRNRLIHEYFGVSTAIVWTLAIREIPRLIPRLRALSDQLC
jgi:uncharacterized protein with HEPN domain